MKPWVLSVVLMFASPVAFGEEIIIVSQKSFVQGVSRELQESERPSAQMKSFHQKRALRDGDSRRWFQERLDERAAERLRDQIIKAYETQTGQRSRYHAKIRQLMAQSYFTRST